jgi:hypothetical protein
MPNFEILLALLIATVLAAWLARRLAIPLPVVLVMGGLAIALLPGIPTVQVPPGLAFAIFVPPTPAEVPRGVCADLSVSPLMPQSPRRSHSSHILAAAVRFESACHSSKSRLAGCGSSLAGGEGWLKRVGCMFVLSVAAFPRTSTRTWLIHTFPVPFKMTP